MVIDIRDTSTAGKLLLEVVTLLDNRKSTADKLHRLSGNTDYIAHRSMHRKVKVMSNI